MKNLVTTNTLLSVDALTLTSGVASNPTVELTSVAVQTLNELAKYYWGGDRGRGFTSAGYGQLAAVTRRSRSTIKRAIRELREAGIIASDGTTYRTSGTTATGNPGLAPTCWFFTAEFVRLGLDGLEAETAPFKVQVSTLARVRELTLKPLGEDKATTTVAEYVKNFTSAPATAKETTQEASVSAVEPSDASEPTPVVSKPVQSENAKPVTWLVEAFARADVPGMEERWSGENFTAMNRAVAAIRFPASMRDLIITEVAQKVANTPADAKPNTANLPAWLQEVITTTVAREEAVEDKRASEVGKMLDEAVEAAWGKQLAAAFKAHKDRDRAISMARDALASFNYMEVDEATLITAVVKRGYKKHEHYRMDSKNAASYIADWVFAPEKVEKTISIVSGEISRSARKAGGSSNSTQSTDAAVAGTIWAQDDAVTFDGAVGADDDDEEESTGFGDAWESAPWNHISAGGTNAA